MRDGTFLFVKRDFFLCSYLYKILIENHRGCAGLSYFSSLATPTMSAIRYCPVPLVAAASGYAHSLSRDI